jgi:gamma-tubulin complex component 2
LLSQLEHAYNSSSQFSLQKLWFYVHPTMHTLSLIYQLTLELATADQLSAESSSSEEDDLDARNAELGLGGAKLSAVLSGIDKDADSLIPVKGGEVLAIIHDRLQNMYGDPAARTLYGTLLKAAGKPYIAMLQTWTRTGKLNDPYEELCVKESKFINRGTLEMDYTDEYWERRYTASNRCIQPRFYLSCTAARRLDGIVDRQASPRWRASAAAGERKTTGWSVYTAAA